MRKKEQVQGVEEEEEDRDDDQTEANPRERERERARSVEGRKIRKSGLFQRFFQKTLRERKSRRVENATFECTVIVVMIIISIAKQSTGGDLEEE